MSESEEADIERLVIEANPFSEVVYEIVQQLTTELPLKSPEQLKERFGRSGLKVGGVAVSVEQILQYLPDELFPVLDRKDLVRKVTAMTRLGIDEMTRAERFPDDEKLTRLMLKVAQLAQPVPVGRAQFQGPSRLGGQTKGI